MKKELLKWCLLLLCLVSQAYAQDRTVSGTVTDKADGSSLPGVSIIVKGTKIGTQTSVDGKFSIQVPAGQSLTFTYLGYATQTVAVTGSVINVALVADAKQLSEVIVTGYGGNQSKLAQTGAVTQVRGEEIENVPLTSFDKALQGRVPGLQSVGGSGQPGSIQQVRIRGIGSIQAGSAPLYVIDGIPINSGDLSRNTTTANALSGINSNDIESITVLKDASAASIYGSRAANGVILVTTKKGRAGATKFRADVEFGSSDVGYLNERNRPLNTAEFRTLTAEGLMNSPSAVTQYGLTAANVGAFVDANFGTAKGVDTKWIDEVTRSGKQAQYNLSANGGNDKTQFNVSGGYFNQDGTVIESNFKRYSGNVNISHKATDKLSFIANLIGSTSNQKGPGTGGLFANPVLDAYFLLPTYTARNADGTPNISSPDFAPGSLFNPVAIAEMDKRNSNFFKGLGSISAEYKILPNLKISSKYGMDYNNLEEDSYNNPFHGDGRNDSGRSYRYYTRYANWVWTNLADYSFNLLEDKSISGNIKGGYEAQRSFNYTSTAIAYGLPPTLDVTVPSAGSIYNTATGSNSDYSFNSLLAIGNISYKNKYVLSGSFRRDGSSRFGSQNQFGNFWSVGASWNLEQESFIKDNFEWVNQLKLRGSYGLNGNADIGNYDWRQLYGYGATYNYLGATGSGPAQVGNQNLTWEVNKPLDLGIDLGILQNRLNVTFEYYTRETSSLLLNEPTSRTTGFTSFPNNVGAMRNRGYELSLSGTPVIVGDFKWDASFNVSHNKNKILALVQNRDQVSSPYIRRVGEDFQSIYVPIYAGVDPANGAPLWYTDGTKSATTPTYAAAQRAIIGSASPTYFGSFGSTFSYKGFSLDGLLYYNVGNLVRDGWANYTQSDGYNATFNRVASQLNRWQKAGDITDVPKYVYAGASASNSLSSRYFYEGDYLRLRDVTLGYTIPKSFLAKAKVSSARLYVRGTNIWTWVKDKDLPWDPEAGGIGSSTNFDVYIPKTYTVGLNVGL